ncbi:putative anti-sigma regulatory factor, serine/threonine protein kinase [Chloroherpeton thalassium ATCC 35110]|uniref:Putative anti-sigma regulatory factor, serine/threonine protein kinase n=2 Tax=Chloroherpeton thalassium TaxID=100716 RepID=B3QTF0_CHLT3|nr:putative anti-sigma regulatory factor, serine/threonine protein kinase [Chloroherpeton thalassium ATCC 35110]
MKMNEMKEKITVTSNLEDLYLVRCFIGNAACRAGFGESETWKIILAVDEACSNVIRHAYNGKTDRNFEITVEFDDNRFVVHIDDAGSGYDLRNHRAPNLQDCIAKRKAGGLGIRIIKELVDEIDYQQVDNRNKLTLTKHLPLEAANA